MLARTMGAKISALRNSASARSWMDVLSEQGKADDGAAIWQLASDGDAFGSSPGMLLLLALLAFEVIGSATRRARGPMARGTGVQVGDRERGDVTTDRLDSIRINRATGRSKTKPPLLRHHQQSAHLQLIQKDPLVNTVINNYMY